MRRVALVVLLFLLAGCAAETAVEPTATVTPALRADAASVAEPAVPATATVAAVVTEMVVEPTAVATHPPAPTEEPTLTELAPTTATEEAAATVEYGRTEEGAYYHGAADAPVTLIDYSDFL